MISIRLSKNFLIAASILVAAILFSASVVLRAQAQSSGNASLSFKKDPTSGYFILTIRDPQGIQEFSVKAPDKSSYGGGFGGCPASRTIDNIGAFNEADFAAGTTGLVVDCQGNEEKFEFPPLKNGITIGKRVVEKVEEKKVEEAPAPVTPPSVPEPAVTPADKEEAAVLLAKSEVKYPVAELGNCKNETDCRNYCEKPKNAEACLNFAEKNNLLPEKELKIAKKFATAGFKGPGNCSSKESCEKYCDNITNINECVAFGEKNEMMSPEELAEAKKVQAALAQGLKTPGNCQSKKECDSYCNNSDNMETCINFGEAAGVIPPDELEDARKVLAAVKKGAKPPPCRGKKECDSYCSEPDNFEGCISFAESAGMMSPTELEESKKVLGAIKKGIKPPPCRGKKECDDFCGKPDNFESCLKFAEAAGFMSEEDLKMARKTGGKGPGNCRGKDECESFCKNPDNQETCFNFAKEHDLIPEEDLRQMEEGKGKMQEALSQAPPEVLECLAGKIGDEMLEKMKAGTGMPSRESGNAMQECFEKMAKEMGPPEGMGPGGQSGPPGSGGNQQGGPGGCQSQEECQAYCEENPEECGGGGLPGGGQSGGGFPGERRDFKGPRNAEECAKQGGSWNDSKCNFRDKTMENIGVDHSGEQCAKQGGNWNGKNCNFSQQHQQQSPGAEEYRRRIQESPVDKLREGLGVPPAGSAPPTGAQPSDQYQQQYQQQFQQQYQQQYQQQFQQQQQNFQPPTGSY